MLTALIHSLSVWNVWDLPLWAWRSYRWMHDEHQRQLDEDRNRKD